MDFEDFLQLISKIKNIPLPAESSHLKMVPPFRRELMKFQEESIKNAKKAGVLALFYPNTANKTNFVLILRKTYKGVHSAQIGFPGGKLEKQDKSLEGAAIRETFEEVGVPVSDISIVKEMTQVYIPPSNFYVHPFMGITKTKPVFKLQDDEVEALLEVDLQNFLEEGVIMSNRVTASYSVDVEVPTFRLNGYVVWGATAMMLSEIKDLLKQAM